jgi:hypothetical protein
VVLCGAQWKVKRTVGGAIFDARRLRNGTGYSDKSNLDHAGRPRGVRRYECLASNDLSINGFFFFALILLNPIRQKKKNPRDKKYLHTFYKLSRILIASNRLPAEDSENREYNYI